MLGGPQGPSSWVWKISPTPGFDPRTIQPVASHYTDYTIPAHRECPHINFLLYWQKASYFVIFPWRVVRNLQPPTLWIYATSQSHPPSFVLFSLHSLTSVLVMSVTEESHVYSLLKKFSSVMCYDEKIILHTKHTYIKNSLLCTLSISDKLRYNFLGLTVPNLYIFALIMFVVRNPDTFQTNASIHSIETRQNINYIYHQWNYLPSKRVSLIPL